MLEARWFKRILYFLYTVCCGFSGYVIYYTAKDGTLYTSIMDHYIAKLLIFGVPCVFCFLTEVLYGFDEFEEHYSSLNALFSPIGCFLCIRLIDGLTHGMTIFGFTVELPMIYIVVYAFALVITWLAGLLRILTADNQRRKYPRAHTHTGTYTPPASTTQSQCGAGGWPAETNPNKIPSFPPYSE